MSKLPPTKSILERHERLRAMRERGTEHEAKVAQIKITRLEARFNLSETAIDEPEGEDLFNTLTSCRRAKNLRKILPVAPDEEEIGSNIKWVFLHRWKVECRWKHEPNGRCGLFAAVDADSARKLQSIGVVIADAYRTLWKQYSGSHALRARERTPFFCGLYDGLMETPRASGERIPMASGLTKKTRRKKAARVNPKDAAPPEVSVHPYEIACALGKLIRTNTPILAVQDHLTMLLTPD